MSTGWRTARHSRFQNLRIIHRQPSTNIKKKNNAYFLWANKTYWNLLATSIQVYCKVTNLFYYKIYFNQLYNINTFIFKVLTAHIFISIFTKLYVDFVITEAQVVRSLFSFCWCSVVLPALLTCPKLFSFDTFANCIYLGMHSIVYSANMEHC